MDNKKIIFQVTKTYMKKNRKRTLVTFLGILVMVMLMTAVFVGKDTVLDYMKNVVEETSGSWHYQVFDIDKKQLQQLKELDCVDKCEVSKPLGYTEFAESGDPDTTPFLELKEYSNDLLKLMNIKLKEGRYPKNPDEVIISARALREGSDIKLGDTIDVDCFERYVYAYTEEERQAAIDAGNEDCHVFFPPNYIIKPGETKKAPAHYQYYKDNCLIEMIHEPTGVNKSLTVVGIMEDPFFAAPGQGGYIAITGLDDSVGDDEKVNAVLTIDVNKKADSYGEIAKILDTSQTPEEREALLADNSSYTTKTGERIPVEKGRIDVNNMLLSFFDEGQNGTMNFIILFVQVFFVVLITAASLILIYNVFSMSYQERSKYLGMLSSVGATRRQKRWSVYYEVFSLLTLALPIGVGLGLIVVKGGVELLAPHFTKMFSITSANMAMERSFDVDFSVVINPVNILLVIIFSTLAVWISAWIPARKISKVGPVESIRGNETTKKHKKKGYKTYLGLMLKGKSENLIGRASVDRNRTATKGIIRSITSFVALTMIISFATGSIGDILNSEFGQDTMSVGTAYKGYKYVFEQGGFLDNEIYDLCKEDIMSSKEVTGYREWESIGSNDWIPVTYYKDEYTDAAKQVIKSWFPNGNAEEIQKYIEGKGAYDNSFINPYSEIVILEEDAFEKVAENAGIDLAKYEESETGPALIYDSIKLSSYDCTLFRGGAQKPDYSEYSFKEPLNVKAGDTIDLTFRNYQNDNEETYDLTAPVEFAGYIKDSDIEEYYDLKPDNLVVFISEKTRENIKQVNSELGDILCKSYKYLFFNVNTDDAGVLKKLSQIRDELNEPCLWPAEGLIDHTSFISAFTNVANIMAVCFTILVALICLLNLYNSVMGRSLARHKEFAVLYSMGMTGKQKNKMLTIENVRLLINAFIKSALITLAFVICLYQLISLRYRGVHITIPVLAIVATILVSIIGLMVFTKVCYRQNSNKQIIDEIRRESV